MPHHPHPEQQKTTEVLTKEGGVRIKIGDSKWTIPTTTVLTSVGMALLASWGYLRSERDELRAVDAAVSAQIAECKGQLATNQVVLNEIRTQLARIDARVAEIQVTLMRGGR